MKGPPIGITPGLPRAPHEVLPFGAAGSQWPITPLKNLRMAQSRGFERPRRSRSQHWNPGGASCRSSAPVVQMLAAASIKVMDALFGFLARNDAEWTKRELLGRTWRRDWAMCQISTKKRFFWGPQKIMGIGCAGMLHGDSQTFKNVEKNQDPEK